MLKESYIYYIQGGQPRKCDKCLGHKPPRAHHCRVCKRCILRMVIALVFPLCYFPMKLMTYFFVVLTWLTMNLIPWFGIKLCLQDHHCLWINNCVGHRNYKSFVLLVFYATVASTYSSVSWLGPFVWLSFISVNFQLVNLCRSVYFLRLCW